jgi:biotin transport system substrate-specific component
VTLQTFAVLMAGCALGSRRGVLAVLLYLEEGFAGLPVFAGGPLGVAHLFGPTGGYLLGFIAAALITGLFVETGATRNWFGRIAALALGSLAVYVPGVLWLGAFTGLGAALSLGFLPFLVGDALKVIAGWGLLTFSSVLGDRGKTSLHNDDR